MSSKLMKRMINTVVSVPVTIFTCCVLIVGSAFIAHWMDSLDSTFSVVGVIGNIKVAATLFICAILCCGMFVGAVFIVLIYLIPFIISGDGLIWRRVDAGDFLQNPDGSTFKKFDKIDFIWRWNAIFFRRKLMCNDEF